MNTQLNAHRSLRRWVGTLLPEPWDVQAERREGLGRPSAVIIPASPKANTGSAYVRDHGQDFDIFAYPPGVEGDSGASRREALELAELIDAAMTCGMKLTDGSYYSYSLRVPVFDYTGIEWEDSLPDGAVPYDFYPAINWTIEPRVDPDDDTLYTVMASVRLRWHTMGDQRRFDGATLQDAVLHHP